MRSNFARKVVYLGLVLCLFVVISLIRRPIEEIRTSRQLADATLGDVDPTSSTMVLVLGGLRGVAANLLWTQAIDMQKEHDWSNLEVVVKSIVKLEPHFISIWTFQGWNLAYNVSVEWDQVNDKYYWIKQGIKFLRSGTEINGHSPELCWDTGWTYFHKIGKADEAVLLKKLFREDDKPELDAQGREWPAFNPDEMLVRENKLPGGGTVDNCQAGGGWFEKAVSKCDQLDVRPKRMGEVAFRSYPSHAQIGHAQSEEDDGNFESAQQGWGDAYLLLQVFADHEYLYLDGKKTKLDYPPAIFSDMYRAVTLMTRAEALDTYLAKDWDKLEPRELVELTKLVWPGQTAGELEGMSPEDRAKLKADWATGVWEMIVRDTPQMLNFFGTPTIDILPPPAGELLASSKKALEKAMALDASKLTLNGSDGDSARKQLKEFTTPAIKLGHLCHEELYWCDRYASMINYRYWKDRAAAESENDAVDARRNFYTGMKSFREGDLETAKREFEDGLKVWRVVLDKYQRIRDDDITAEETIKIVKTYQAVCQQLDVEVAQNDLPFQEYLQKYAQPQFTPEEFELVTKSLREVQQGSPEEIEAKKKEIMEKFGDRFKPKQ